jgi:hypothetical protein
MQLSNAGGISVNRNMILDVVLFADVIAKSEDELQRAI